jgi:secreted PhoX family phosphatase
VCAFRLGKLHAGCTDRSLRGSFWRRPLRTWERRRLPGWHDLRGHQYRDRRRANGDVDVYPPNANGDVAPEASFTNGMYGPTTMVFDSSGDLWVANENTSDLFEFTKAQLAMRNPVPAVTIFAESGALANPFGMAFDDSGNLWVVSNNSSRVYEYTKSQLASSGGPTPHTTISDFPSTPIFGVAFDASGDLWVSTVKSVVEFSKAELAKAKPVPTVTISSSGGAQLVFDPSGDLWMVTGGAGLLRHPLYQRGGGAHQGPALTSGSPTPAVTISSTKVGAAGSIYGPYSLAFTPPVTCGLRTSTTTPQSSSARTSFPSRGRPPLCGPSLAQVPG